MDGIRRNAMLVIKKKMLKDMKFRMLWGTHDPHKAMRHVTDVERLSVT